MLPLGTGELIKVPKATLLQVLCAIIVCQRREIIGGEVRDAVGFEDDGVEE